MAESSVSGEMDLAQELCNWAINTMHFIPQGVHAGSRLPTVEDFRYVCRGQMNDIWRYVIKHVHPAQKVSKVKGNLLLNRLQEEKGDTVKSDTISSAGRDVMCELKTTRSSLQHVEQEVERLQPEIAATEQSYRAAVSRLHDVDRRRALLVAYSRSTAEEIERISELSTRVRSHLQKMKDLKKKASEPPVMLSRNVPVEGCDPTLETACSKSVCEACQVIGQFLHQLLQGSFEGDETAMNRNKEQLWNCVESVTSDYSADCILASLCEYADNSAVSLRDKIAGIDIRKDAEQLRFKYESGQLSDLSTPPTVFQSVHQILEARQAAAFSKFVDTEKHKNNSWKLQKRLSEASATVDDLMRRHYDNPETLQVARNIVEAETRLASARAAVNTLSDISTDLSAKIEQAAADRDLLYAKYQKIQDFKKIADAKQNLIRVLVKQNLNARTKLLTQQSENVEYVEKSLKGSEPELEQLSSQLKDCVVIETGAFTRLPLTSLPTLTIDSVRKVAIVDLSIYKLDETPSVHCQQMIRKLLTSLDIPSFTASEFILTKIADIQTRRDRLSLVLKAPVTGTDKDIERKLDQLQKLCSEVSQHDKEQRDRLLPVLQQRLTQATQSLTDCLCVKDIAADWWNQPAQFCTPWVTVDGQSLQQWHDKFTVIATRLRQLPSTH